MADTKVIWQITDGKRGHENQSSGLIQALSRLHDIKLIPLPLSANRASWWQVITGRYAPAKILPQPDLIIGTGSQTHSTLLAASRATQAPSIVIMAPPRGLTHWFSLCIIPEHDNRSGQNIVTTKGAMNLIQPGRDKDPLAGLFLIGGPSQHHAWSEADLLTQLDTILNAESTTRWTLTTSRRTPETTTRALQAIQHPRLKVIPVEDTPADWLPTQLANTSLVWATEDSVSMVYEALTSGAKVGVLPVPRKSNNSRVIRGLDTLTTGGYLLPYTTTQPDLAQFNSPPALNEAQRLAEIVAKRFFK